MYQNNNNDKDHHQDTINENERKKEGYFFYQISQSSYIKTGLKEVEIALHRLETMKDVENFTILGVETTYGLLNSLLTMLGSILGFVLNQMFGIGEIN